MTPKATLTSVETVTIVELERIAGIVLVTFSDGRVTTLDRDDLYARSEPPPPDLEDF